MKLFRTYIGGCKKNELLVFKSIIENNNWIEYQKQFIIFSNDIILTYSTRIQFLKILSNLLIIISIILLSSHLYELFIILIILSSIVILLKYYQSKKLRRILILNNITINIIKFEINRIYNM